MQYMKLTRVSKAYESQSHKLCPLCTLVYWLESSSKKSQEKENKITNLEKEKAEERVHILH